MRHFYNHLTSNTYEGPSPTMHRPHLTTFVKELMTARCSERWVGDFVGEIPHGPWSTVIFGQSPSQASRYHRHQPMSARGIQKIWEAVVPRASLVGVHAHIWYVCTATIIPLLKPSPAAPATSPIPVSASLPFPICSRR